MILLQIDRMHTKVIVRAASCSLLLMSFQCVLATGPLGPSLEKPAAKSITSQVAEDDSSIQAKDLSYDIRIETIVEPPAEYHFSSFGREDPFMPPLARMKSNIDRRKSQAKYGIPIVNSMQVSLSNLTVRGIWQLANGERRALVIASRDVRGEGDGDPSRALQEEEGVVAKVGDLIGPAGKIIEIDESAVVTRQYKLLRDGTRTFDEVVLHLGGLDASKKQIDERYVIRPGENPVLEKIGSQ